MIEMLTQALLQVFIEELNGVFARVSIVIAELVTAEPVTSERK